MRMCVSLVKAAKQARGPKHSAVIDESHVRLTFREDKMGVRARGRGFGVLKRETQDGY